MLIRKKILLLNALLAAGCASQPAALPPIPDGAAVHLEVTVLTALDQPSASNGGMTAANMAGGTAAGIGFGAAYGAYLGLACGPYFFFCSPALAIGGAMGGGIAGLGIGTVEAVRLAIPAEKADAMNAVIEHTLADFDFTATLDVAFRAGARGRWRYSNSAPVDLTVSLISVDIDKHPHDRISLRVVSILELVDRSGTRESTAVREFVGESLPRYVDEWLAADGELFAMELEAAITRSARDMVASLSGY